VPEVLTAAGVTVRTARLADAARIAEIWNHEVLHTDHTTDTEPRTVAQQRAWLARRNADHPVIVVTRRDDVIAFGALSPYRPKPAFHRTVEDSVYVHRTERGQGLGALVLGRLIELARERGHRSILARITGVNEPSMRLHERLGFRLVGVEEETAFKRGRWLDVAILQRRIAG
jgi:phosphinothricin acetyltransferase